MPAAAPVLALPQAAGPVLVDPLTGLLSHRAFQERLRAAVRDASVTRDDLALAVIDVDHFQGVNRSAGHGTGDRVLRAIAEQLLRFTRSADALGRTGGDEFALLLPGCRGRDALAVIDRARGAIGATRLAGGLRITVSAGVCDLATVAGTGAGAEPDADELFRLAGGALYWSKRHGRDLACVYDSREVRELSATDRAQRLERSRALVGLRALARAIDAKDHSTRQHSDRVAVLAGRLAGVLGWSAARIAMLEETALVHDVGKIGVPDAILLKPGALDTGEYEQMKQHAPRGAAIVADVLSTEQVRWLRGHHERPDGRGYPDGLAAGQIPAGAAVLAVADAFDVMTMARSYSRSRSRHEALAECQALIGRQFEAAPVAALETLILGRGRT